MKLPAILVTVLLATSSLAAAQERQTCAGYPVLSQADYGPAPKDVAREEVNVNPDAAADLLASYPAGGRRPLYQLR